MRNILMFLLSVGIVACNNGGGSSGVIDNSSGSIANPSGSEVTDKVKLMGLSNLGNSCYINSALQLIVNNTNLRKIVISQNPANSQMFIDFFDAYDRADNARVKSIHKQITQHIYSLPGMPGAGHTASSVEVFYGDQLTYNGLNIITSTLDPTNSNTFLSDVNNNLSSNIYSFAFHATSNNWSTIKYSEIPLKERLYGFSYNSGNHYITYIKQDGEWYEINDSIVKKVDVKKLESLSKNQNTGIELVVYSK